MSLWTDNRGLSLEATASKDYLYLRVDPARAPVMRPFMALQETQGSWKEGPGADGKTMMGWFVPVANLAVLNPFLNIARHVEADKAVKTENRATVHYISPSESVALMLFAKLPEKTVESLQQWRGVTTASSAANNAVVALDGTATILPTLVDGVQKSQYAHSYLNLLYRYILQRDSGSMAYGDILRHRFQPKDNEGLYLFGQQGLVPLGAGGSLPDEFTTPPFMVMWWYDFEGGIVGSKNVHPKFMYPGLQVEYDVSPDQKLVEHIKTNPKINAAYVPVALRCTLNTYRFNVLFFAPAALTYEALSGLVADPKNLYTAYDNNTIWTTSDLTAAQILDAQRAAEFKAGMQEPASPDVSAKTAVPGAPARAAAPLSAAAIAAIPFSLSALDEAVDVESDNDEEPNPEDEEAAGIELLNKQLGIGSDVEDADTGSGEDE